MVVTMLMMTMYRFVEVFVCSFLSVFFFGFCPFEHGSELLMTMVMAVQLMMILELW